MWLWDFSELLLAALVCYIDQSRMLFYQIIIFWIVSTHAPNIFYLWCACVVYSHVKILNVARDEERKELSQGIMGVFVLEVGQSKDPGLEFVGRRNHCEQDESRDDKVDVCIY